MVRISFAMNGVCFLLSNSHNKIMLCNGKLDPYRRLKQLISWRNKSMCTVSNENTGNNKRKFETFDDICQIRRNQAERTVMIQVQNFEILHKVINSCLKYDNVTNVYKYQNLNKSLNVLLEFQSKNGVQKFLNAATYLDTSAIPVYSHFLWYKNNLICDSKNMNKINVNVHNDIMHSEQQIFTMLNEMSSISRQMSMLYQLYHISETETRLRFLVANQVEKSLTGLFPHIKVIPFGSSINGFGKQGSDLDLAISFSDLRMSDNRSNFVYVTKTIIDEKQKVMQELNIIAEQMKLLMPGITNVRKILHARVPIIKCAHGPASLECDISITNMTGIYMSELLYLYGQIDERVKPLVFTIRMWAHFFKLTNPSPGLWITNFSLTLLTLHFLQVKKILPTLNKLQQLAGKEDFRETNDNIDCTFLRNINKLPMSEKNTETLESLLYDFFCFYAKFDFLNFAISIREGTGLAKKDSSPLYIFNPLETDLNVSRNVSVEEVERFKRYCNFSATSFYIKNTKKNKQLGLISLFNNRGILNKNFRKKIVPQVNILNLFEENIEENKNLVRRSVDS